MTGFKDVIYLYSRTETNHCWLHHVTSRWILTMHVHNVYLWCFISSFHERSPLYHYMCQKNEYIYIGFIERGLRLKAVRSKISASGITVAITASMQEQLAQAQKLAELAWSKEPVQVTPSKSLGIPRTKRAASKMGRSSKKTADFLLPCLSARSYSLSFNRSW